MVRMVWKRQARVRTSRDVWRNDALFQNKFISEGRMFRADCSGCARSSSSFHVSSTFVLCVSWVCVRGWDCVLGSSATLQDRCRGRFTANYFQLNGPRWAAWTTTKWLQETSVPDKPAPPFLHDCYTEAACRYFTGMSAQNLAPLKECGVSQEDLK